MPHTIDHLRLDLVFPEPGHKSPAIALLDERDAVLDGVPTSEPIPRLGLCDESVRSIEALDILEHVHDEQAWLAEFARVLVPNGDLAIRVPLENMMAWVDALNIYRYISDVTSLGEHPLETIPTGWHRHYAPGDLPAILELAGFEVVSTTTQGLPLQEIPHLAGLVVGKIMMGRHGSERRLFELRQRFRDRPSLPLPASIAATISIAAKRRQPAFRPDPDLDRDHRPEMETGDSLE